MPSGGTRRGRRSCWDLGQHEHRPADAARVRYGCGADQRVGGFEFGQFELRKLWSKGPEQVVGYQSFAGSTWSTQVKIPFATECGGSAACW